MDMKVSFVYSTKKNMKIILNGIFTHIIEKKDKENNNILIWKHCTFLTITKMSSLGKSTSSKRDR